MRPADEVFAYVTDPARFPEWQAGVVNGHLDGGGTEVGARCVGIPIRDYTGRPVGAISISGPVARIPFELVATIGRRLQAAAAGIEERLGYSKERQPEVAAAR